jgi:hypothetical protein
MAAAPDLDLQRSSILETVIPGVSRQPQSMVAFEL